MKALGRLPNMASMALQPRDVSPLSFYFKTQIRTKCRSPPTTISFAGHTALITGSNTGIGLEACRQMLARGLCEASLRGRLPRLVYASLTRT